MVYFQYIAMLIFDLYNESLLSFLFLLYHNIRSLEEYPLQVHKLSAQLPSGSLYLYVVIHLV